MKNILTTLALFLSLLIPTSLAAADKAPDKLLYPDVVVYEAQKIITMEPGLPEGRFVATADGIILGLAKTKEELSAWTKGRNVKWDEQFADRILMPGFVEPHVHPMQAVIMMPLPFIAPEDWELPGKTYPAARGAAEYEKLLRAEMAKSDARPFITWGHHQLFHGDMNRAILDRIAPDRPVVIWQRSFHEIIANTKALELLKLGNEAAFKAAFNMPDIDPDHADYVTGVIHETALGRGLEALQPYLFSPKNVQTGMAGLRQMMLENGVTTSADMAFGLFGGLEREYALFKPLFNAPTTPARMLLVPGQQVVEGDPNDWLAATKAKHDSEKLFMRNRVKLFADGAFFAQYMQMNPPGYSDGHKGKWLTEPEELEKQTARFWNAGWNLHTHVNGDKGLDVVLGITEHLNPGSGQDIVLEHLGYSTEAQNRRISRLGLMVSAQPNYIRVLGDAYAKTGLGPDRAAQMNRLGSLERKGVPLGLHSDFNMAPVDPLYLAWVAANRITLNGNEKAPAERLSLDKALRAVTIEAAQVIGMDDEVGSIAAGKKADFVVLKDDPYELGAAKLRDVRIDGVVFEGRYFPAPN